MRCPSCGRQVDPNDPTDTPLDLCSSDRDEWAALTLASPDHLFPHQLLVDAYMVQHAENSKPVARIFAPLGLGLVAEYGFNGREVQLAHIALANEKPVEGWPSIGIPSREWQMTLPNLPLDSDLFSLLRPWVEATWEDLAGEQAQIMPFIDRALELLPHFPPKD